MAIQTVSFQWSDEKGECLDCGLPAAYEITDLYGDKTTVPYPRMCSVCAAGHAADGHTIVWLFEL